MVIPGLKSPSSVRALSAVYFGGMLARAGAPVTFIGRPAFVEAVQKDGLLLDTTQFKERVRATASAISPPRAPQKSFCFA